MDEIKSESGGAAWPVEQAREPSDSNRIASD